MMERASSLAMHAAHGMDFRIEPVQTLAFSAQQRAEGIAISSSGNMMAIATADADTVVLHRRQPSGRFDAEPCGVLCGPTSRLNYPHDLSFALVADGELLAVAQRRGSIAIFRNDRITGCFAPEPAFEISGAGSRLNFSDGVAFVPPLNDHLAACNLASATISFYRKRSDSPLVFDQYPCFELWQGLAEPDGLAFSPSGEWLAVANHGNHSVSIFERRNRVALQDKFRFGPAPVAVIADAGFRYPHSLAFSASNHLVGTNAGANCFSVFAPTKLDGRTQWSLLPGGQWVVGSESGFRAINAANKMEGGPKGIAIHRDTLAVCSPQHGVLIYSLLV
jgi:DNA-binding beta-propeller fold protein YncE